MKKSLLKLSGAILLASVLVGCGSDNKGDNKKEPDSKPQTVCTFTVAKGTDTLKIGEKFEDKGATAVTTADKKAVTEKLVTSIMMGDKKAEKIDTSKEGVYTITYTFPKTCKAEKATRTVTIKKATTTASGTVNNGFVDPF